MFDIGFWELLLIAIVALVVVGPERLPKLLRVIGLWVGKANASIQSIRNEISRELRAEELKQALNKTLDVGDLNNNFMDSDPVQPSTTVNNDDAVTSTESKTKEDNG